MLPNFVWHGPGNPTTILHIYPFQALVWTIHSDKSKPNITGRQFKFQMLETETIHKELGSAQCRETGQSSCVYSNMSMELRDLQIHRYLYYQKYTIVYVSETASISSVLSRLS